MHDDWTPGGEHQNSHASGVVVGPELFDRRTGTATPVPLTEGGAVRLGFRQRRPADLDRRGLTCTEVRIRPAADGDIPELARLFATSVRTLQRTAYSPSQVASWAASAENEARIRDLILHPRTDVAVNVSGFLGFAGIGPDGHVASVYVRPDRHRCGFGSRLLWTLINHATIVGIDRRYAEASEFSLPLFLKLGFRKSGTETFEHGGGLFVRHLVEVPMRFADADDQSTS